MVDTCESRALAFEGRPIQKSGPWLLVLCSLLLAVAVTERDVCGADRVERTRVEVEALSWTLTIAGRGPGGTPDAGLVDGGDVGPLQPVARQKVFDPRRGERVDAPVYLRADLPPGCRLRGPALITEDQTTTVVTSEYDILIDNQGSIVLTRGTSAEGGTET